MATMTDDNNARWQLQQTVAMTTLQSNPHLQVLQRWRAE
jgi:hypothetical protein